MPRRSRPVGLRPTFVALVFVVAAAANAAAEPIKCQSAIALAGAKFVAARAAALAKCATAVVKGTTSPPCPDTRAVQSITKATAKLAAAIDKACGGRDKHCGGDRTGEDTPQSLDWPATCPNLEHGACTNTIDHCGGIAACVACTGGAAIDQALHEVSDDLVLPSTGQLRTCQATIARATAKSLAARSRALAQCWSARLHGKHTDDCIPPAIGDGKYLRALDKARSKQRSLICAACGGADQTCGTADDLAPSAIGFPTDCAALTPPSGGSCAGTVSDLTALVDCVDCVDDFATTCTDRLQLPALTPYPAACNVCLAAPPSGPCPSVLQFQAAGPAVDLDTGWTGLAHDAKVPTNSRLTLAISGCAGTTQPTCGECAVGGPLPNAGGIAFDDHRCADASWIPCAGDTDCTSAGAAGPCVFFFGPPLPLVAGGVPSCVVNQIGAPVTGTVNLDDGSSSTHVTLSSAVHIAGNTVSHPCPVCSGGTCELGLHDGQPCTVQGSGDFGDVSLDCPPLPSALVGTLTIDLNLATGTQSRTLTAAQPACRASGYGGRRCQCDTCNDANEEACSSNADCPPSGGNPGVCGGRRCILGSNTGMPCTLNSECPGGSCGRAGLETQPNACNDDTSTPLDGSICENDGNDEGHCPEGPFNPSCSVERFRGCTTDADCNCADCIVGQTCLSLPRKCFLDGGTIGGADHVTGAPDVPCAGVGYPTVGSFFCVAPVAANAVNSAAGLPGLGRVRIPGRVSIAP